MADSSAPAGPAPTDPVALLRSRGLMTLLVFAAALGIVVSLIGWAFLELVHAMQEWVFFDLPSGLGLESAPSWWPVVVCTAASVVVAFAIARLPGAGGHLPADGLKAGGTEPSVVRVWRWPRWPPSGAASCWARKHR